MADLKKILLVQDEGTLRSTFVAKLEKQDYLVVAVSSVHEAMQHLDPATKGYAEAGNDPFKAILFNNPLRNETYDDLLTEMRRHGVKVPVFVIAETIKDKMRTDFDGKKIAGFALRDDPTMLLSRLDALAQKAKA